MAGIQLRGLTKRFGSVVAVDDLSLDVADGELIALLGPSGCGKTTTLRTIAGFETPDAGEIYFGERRVSDLLPEQRRIGMVFQNYALFPHMTVAENVAFGLEMRKTPAAALRERVAAVLAKVQLTGLEKRYPRQLSGRQPLRHVPRRAHVSGLAAVAGGAADAARGRAAGSVAAVRTVRVPASGEPTRRRREGARVPGQHRRLSHCREPVGRAARAGRASRLV